MNDLNPFAKPSELQGAAAPVVNFSRVIPRISTEELRALSIPFLSELEDFMQSGSNSSDALIQLALREIEARTLYAQRNLLKKTYGRSVSFSMPDARDTIQTTPQALGLLKACFFDADEKSHEIAANTLVEIGQYALAIMEYQKAGLEQPKDGTSIYHKDAEAAKRKGKYLEVVGIYLRAAAEKNVNLLKL